MVISVCIVCMPENYAQTEHNPCEKWLVLAAPP